VLDGHDARPARLHHDRPLEADCGIQLATGAAFVKDAKVPVRVDFSDDVAGPFPANFLCFTVGRSCDTNAGDIYGYNASCSVPATGGKSTTFSCTADYGAVADGTVSACVVAADASIPDNPSGSNQTASADKANLSHPSCDEVVVDRTPPAVSIAVAKTTVEVGELVALQATASDTTSGLAGAGRWSWGDNTGGGSGDAVTHTFTQPGTYEVALTVADAAGNAATARKAITVKAAAQPGDGTTTPPGGGTTTPPGGGTTTPPGDGTTTPPGGGTTTPDDGGSAEPVEQPSLELYAPRKARARAKSIPVELTASDGGRVQLSLARVSRVIARAGVRLDEDGTADYRLKLPKGSKAGRYTLKATYGAITVSRKLTLTGRSARRARTSSRPGVELGRGPRALPDGRFHGERPARTFKVR
jgi:PKD repeat protein